MTLQFAHPDAFLLLFALPLFWWVWRGRSAPPPSHFAQGGRRRGISARRWVAVIVRTLLLVLLVLALAGPQTSDVADELQVMFVLDRSKSIPGRQMQVIESSLTKATALMDEKDRAGLVVFGSKAALEARPNHGRIFHGQISAVVEDDLTNIESGIRLALTSFPDGVGKRIVLISDGNENRGSLMEMAALAAANGVQIDVMPVRYDYPNEVYVEKVVLPQRVNFGEPFMIRTVVHSTVETTGKLTIFENDKPLNLPDNTVNIPVGKSVHAVKLLFQDEEKIEAIRKGFYVYEVRVTPLDESGSPDVNDQSSNNRAIGFTQVQGRPAVLLVDGNELQGEILEDALVGQGILVRRIEPLELPDNIIELQGYDCVILYNVGVENFTRAQLTMLKSNVRDVGSGLIMIGGENSFGAGGWLDTPVEEALPVYMDLKQEKILPNGALCCIMHTCEFPDGNRWAKDICIAAMKTLSAQDYFGIVYYPQSGGDCRWGFKNRMVKPVNKGALANIIKRQLNPGDMPDYDNAFSVAQRGLAGVNAALKHIIVISDGDATPPSKNLVRRIRNSRITISAIAIAPHMRGTQTLKDLARAAGGRFYNISDPRKLPRIFVHEAQVVRKAILVEKHLQPVLQQLTEPILGVAEGGVPPIDGYVATTRKELADVPILAEGDMPLLAHWRYGLGRTIAYTSDATTRWGKDWMGWGSFSQFWGQMVRWCQKTVVDANYQVRTTMTDGAATIAVDAVDDQGRFKNNLTVKATVVASMGDEAVEVELIQTAPGHYEVEVAAEDVGAYLVNLRYEEPTVEGGEERQVSAGQTTGFSVPYSPEFRQLAANEALLEQVAELTGGHVLQSLAEEQVLPGYTAEDPYHVFVHDHAPTTRPMDRWQPLLLLAAIVFVLDVFVRRVLVDYGKILAALGVVLPFLKGAGVRAQREARKLAEVMRPQTSSAPPTSPDADAVPGGARPEWLKEDAGSAQEGAEAMGGGPAASEAPPPAPAADAGESSSYTNRLLEAKRRARKGHK